MSGRYFQLSRLGFTALGGLLAAALVASLWAAEKKPPERKPAEKSSATYTLQSKRLAGGSDRVEISLELGGDQKIREGEEATVKKFATKVAAELAYDERTLHLSGPMRSVRRYLKAKADITSGEERMQPTLRPERTLVIAEAAVPKVTLFSPRGALLREELDLIDLLGNSLLLDQLLPEKAVAIGEKWKHSESLMTALLGLDAVRSSDVQSTLTEVNGGQARFEVDGRVEGAIGGISTTISLKGKYRFDQASGRIAWFGLLVKEERDIGHIGPGLDVIARLKMTVTPEKTPPELTNASLQNLSLVATPDTTLLTYISPQGGWQFDHDRRWYVVSDRDDLALLRMIDRGEFVAQCNVSSLAKAEAGKQTSLADFQKSIQQGLDKQFKRFIKAGEGTNAQGLRICRVVAEGEASDLPIQWVYYLVSDAQGRQVVFAFTLEKKYVESFAEADQRLVGGARLIEPQVAAKSTR
jgi:hypothetical protein